VSIITITSDYGLDSTYQAILVGNIYARIPEAKVVYLHNHIEKFNLVQAAFVLKTNTVFFPEGTWHFICVDCNIIKYKQVLVVEYNRQFYVGVDNGIFSLLFNIGATKVYKIMLPEFNKSLFAENDFFIPAAAHYFKNKNLKGIAQPGTIKNIKQNIEPTQQGKILRGIVMYIDGFGNAITNISKDLFYRHVGSKQFLIYYSRKFSINQISEHFGNQAPSEEIALFNSAGYLQICVVEGSAHQLMGLKYNSPIMIEKND
jgi:S-adenosylmethionine hydrolase